MKQFCYPYPRPMVTVDCMIICKSGRGAEILLIQRKNEPFKSFWAFPGGFVDMEEDLDDAVCREVLEETGLVIQNPKQYLTIGTPGRDPRGRTITVIFYIFVDELAKNMVRAADDAAFAQWFPVKCFPELAFDHKKILNSFIEANLI